MVLDAVQHKVELSPIAIRAKRAGITLRTLEMTKSHVAAEIRRLVVLIAAWTVRADGTHRLSFAPVLAHAVVN